MLTTVAVVLCCDVVEQIKQLTKSFMELGIDADHVTWHAVTIKSADHVVDSALRSASQAGKGNGNADSDQRPLKHVRQFVSSPSLVRFVFPRQLTCGLDSLSGFVLDFALLIAQVFMNLCDGTTEDGYPGIEVVQSLEKAGCAFTGKRVIV